MANMLKNGSESGSGPLKGLRVLDLGNMIAGPFSTALMGDLGAEVVKAEHPVYGDDIRQWPPQKDGEPLWWKVTARNKRLITLDMGKPAGRDIVLRAVKDFDIVVENFRPGTFERWGLGYDELSKVNPKIIFTRVSGYGQSGPYGHRPGYGTVAEALSGVPAFTGFPDSPTLSAFPMVDCIAGLTATMATLAAVHERDVAGSGIGQVVDVTLFESLFRLVENQVIAFDQLGIVKERLGNRMAEDSPRNAYQTSDGGYIAVSAGSQRTFSRLAAAMGQPQLADDPRYANAAVRADNAVELDEQVAAWFATQKLADVTKLLEDADVVAGPVYDIRDIMNDPHFKAREDIIEVEDPKLGTIRMPGVMPKFSRTPGEVRHPGGTMGADNDWFYLESLGLTPEELATLKEEKVV
jgi:crotonobetainyl-CoA:carnitine CoA-transferase CaiB-like acyl-CoA transferase